MICYLICLLLRKQVNKSYSSQCLPTKLAAVAPMPSTYSSYGGTTNSGRNSALILPDDDYKFSKGARWIRFAQVARSKGPSPQQVHVATWIRNVSSGNQTNFGRSHLQECSWNVTEWKNRSREEKGRNWGETDEGFRSAYETYRTKLSCINDSKRFGKRVGPSCDIYQVKRNLRRILNSWFFWDYSKILWSSERGRSPSLSELEVQGTEWFREFREDVNYRGRLYDWGNP